jgi:hypothetical protein
MVEKRKFNAEYEVVFVLLLVAVLNSTIYAALRYNKDLSRVLFGQEILVTFWQYAFIIGVIVFLLWRKKMKILKYGIYAILALMTFHIFQNLFYLIVTPQIQDKGGEILVDAMLIWIANVCVFSLWYWVLDAGGPIARYVESKKQKIDFLFPQEQNTIDGWGGWKAQFGDYVSLSFFTSTGFTPADVLPLSQRVKILMVMEASVSLVIIGMVTSRAINLIGS